MPSFDVVSKVPMNEVDNALNQAQKEIVQRFDFKDTNTVIEKNDDGLLIRSSSQGRLEAARHVLQEKLTKRNVAVSYLDPKPPTPAGGDTWKQVIGLKEGLAIEKAKEIVKFIKESTLKVQGSIQADQVRVTGKKKDDLQSAIAALRAKDFEQPLQFINFRD